MAQKFVVTIMSGNKRDLISDAKTMLQLTGKLNREGKSGRERKTEKKVRN